MDYNYLVSINLDAKKVYIVGGGNVAKRKVKDLAKTRAKIVLVSPEIEDGLKRYLNERKIKYHEEEYNEERIKDAFLVVAATNSREINSSISWFCNDNNILVNVVDSREESSFIVNSVIRKGDLTISVSTNGKAPALAAKIRRELEEKYTLEYAIFIELLAEMRERAKAEIESQEKRSEFLREIAGLDVISTLNEGNIEKAKEMMEKCILSYLD